MEHEIETTFFSLSKLAVMHFGTTTHKFELLHENINTERAFAKEETPCTPCSF